MYIKNRSLVGGSRLNFHTAGSAVFQLDLNRRTQAFAVTPSPGRRKSQKPVEQGKSNFFKANLPVPVTELGIEKYIGPLMRGVTERRVPVLVKSWIKKFAAMIVPEMPTQVALYKEYITLSMPFVCFFLSDAWFSEFIGLTSNMEIKETQQPLLPLQGTADVVLLPAGVGIQMKSWPKLGQYGA